MLEVLPQLSTTVQAPGWCALAVGRVAGHEEAKTGFGGASSGARNAVVGNGGVKVAPTAASFVIVRVQVVDGTLLPAEPVAVGAELGQAPDQAATFELPDRVASCGYSP